MLAAISVASPLVAFPLTVGVTDPPIIALTCLTLALATRRQFLRAALVARGRLRDEVHRLGRGPGARGA